MPQNNFVRKLILVLVRSHRGPNAEERSARDFEMDKMKHAGNIGYQNDAYV